MSKSEVISQEIKAVYATQVDNRWVMAVDYIENIKTEGRSAISSDGKELPYTQSLQKTLISTQ